MPSRQELQYVLLQRDHSHHREDSSDLRIPAIQSLLGGAILLVLTLVALILVPSQIAAHGEANGPKVTDW